MTDPKWKADEAIRQEIAEELTNLFEKLQDKYQPLNIDIIGEFFLELVEFSNQLHDAMEEFEEFKSKPSIIQDANDDDVYKYYHDDQDPSKLN